MSRIQDSNLFKSFPKKNGKITMVELLKELTKVKRSNAGVVWTEKSMSSAFVWVLTPQGHRFWSDIHTTVFVKPEVKKLDVKRQNQYKGIV